MDKYRKLKNVKLIVCDIDNTLVRKRQDLSERGRNAVKKLKEKDNTIAYLQTEKIKLETYMQKLKKNQAEINKDFERINPQLDAIMAKIEAFYKENYPDYLW